MFTDEAGVITQCQRENVFPGLENQNGNGSAEFQIPKLDHVENATKLVCLRYMQVTVFISKLLNSKVS